MAPRGRDFFVQDPGGTLGQQYNMNDTRHQSLFFVSLPELQKLCATTVTLNSWIPEAETRSTQIKICRQLLFLYQDILSAPVIGTLNQISVVMTIPFYKSGICQAYIERQGATLKAPQSVSPAILQTCLSYTLTARLAPRWNKAGHLLVQGKEFLSHSGRQNAVVVDLNVSERQLCISVEPCSIRLPPAELEDFDISANTLKLFDSNENTVIHQHSILSNWCYVLPSMKMGQIISISHIIPPESPFRSYTEFQMHWKNLEIKSKHMKLASEMVCVVSLTEAPPRKQTLPNSSSCSMESSHWMEHLIKEPETHAFLSSRKGTEEVSIEATRKSMNDRQIPGVPELPVVKSLGMPVNSAFELPPKKVSKIIPIFKGKLLQMNGKTSNQVDGKKREKAERHSPIKNMGVSPSMLSVCKSSILQVYKPVQNMSVKNPAHSSIFQQQTKRSNGGAELNIHDSVLDDRTCIAKNEGNKAACHSKDCSAKTTSHHSKSNFEQMITGNDVKCETLTSKPASSIKESNLEISVKKGGARKRQKEENSGLKNVVWLPDLGWLRACEQISAIEVPPAPQLIIF
ncbi:hypothetical protein AV530_006116 [Patagioenas fasciata monilis]|uniref:DUF4708 domain-containing protein n=1 Tax=Patagioenas fasciata monilis TaxID=372326 RepID=A0A1V4J9P6_PATFA|nr:hypothetical protein AV530_006116 [Patagioenas fasciata monilis]